MRVKRLGGRGLEITRNGGKPLSVGVIKVRGGGQKAQPLCGKSSKLGGCLEAGGGRWRKMERGGAEGTVSKRKIL